MTPERKLELLLRIEAAQLRAQSRLLDMLLELTTRGERSLPDMAAELGPQIDARLGQIRAQLAAAGVDTSDLDQHVPFGWPANGVAGEEAS